MSKSLVVSTTSLVSFLNQHKGPVGEVLARLVLQTPCCSCCYGDEEYEAIVVDEIRRICTIEELKALPFKGAPSTRIWLGEGS